MNILLFEVEVHLVVVLNSALEVPTNGENFEKTGHQSEGFKLKTVLSQNIGVKGVSQGKKFFIGNCFAVWIGNFSVEASEGFFSFENFIFAY